MKRIVVAMAPLLVLLPAAPGAVAGKRIDGLPANVVSQAFPAAVRTYPVLDRTGQAIGTTRWRVVRNTGNCCENHFAATADGRLLDFGGTYIHFTDDKGATWRRVAPIEPFMGGEGTITVAANGDVLGVAWDVYSGDRILGFKWDAATKLWTYQNNVLHTPFYDREWVAVVERPGILPGRPMKNPYMSILKGGWPSKDVWSYSFDGVHYTLATNKRATGVGQETVSRWLPTTRQAAADWTQSITASSITPLPGGGALARPADTLDSLFGGGWMILEPGTLRWSPFRLGDGSVLPPGRLLIDSNGHAHLLNASGGTVTYRLSRDGGRTWDTTTASLPAGSTVEEWDAKASGALGRAIVGVHAHRSSTNTDQDYVLEFATGCGAPQHLMTHVAGAGNLNAGSGVGASIRFDFATVALLPDGTIVTSLQDQSQPQPSAAIALETTPNDPEAELPQPSC